MKLANKPVYPFTHYMDDFTKPEISDGLTFRERLIVALASNPSAVEIGCDYKDNADMVIKQADAIIKQLEAEK